MHTFRLGLLFSLMLVLFACQEDFKTGTPMTWTQLKPFPGVARASACGFAADGKLFVGLGRSESRGGYLKDFWCYDLQDSTWTRLADFPGTPRVKALAAYVNGKGYVGMGGTSAFSQPFRDFWQYDLATNTWSQADSFPVERSIELMYAVSNGAIYAMWGFNGIMDYTDELFRFDPVTDHWTKMSQRTPRSNLSAAAFAVGNVVYVGGGYHNYNVTRFYAYNTASDRWKRCADMPNKRMLSDAVGIGSKGYYLLGRFWSGSLNNGRLLSDVLEYDPASDSWTSRGDFPGGARQNTVVLEWNGCGYVIFGETDTQRLSDLWKFEP